ncbi:unnamed protein product [Urochloa humidicola]
MCVGTLEFRSIVEPVSRIQSALATGLGSYFASCTGIDTRAHTRCTARPPPTGRNSSISSPTTSWREAASDHGLKALLSSSFMISVSLQANEILSSFDVGLRQYTTNHHLSKCGVKLVGRIVKEVKPTEITLSEWHRRALRPAEKLQCCI